MKKYLKVGVLASYHGSLLLIKEINKKNKKYYWNIIKGTFEPKKDKDLLATARREALEEAGVKILVKSFSSIMIKRGKKYISIQININADLLNKKFKLAPKSEQVKENEKICEVKFFTKRELKKLRKGDFMTERAFVASREWLEGKKTDISRLKFFS